MSQLGRAEELVSRAQSLHQKLEAERADTDISEEQVRRFVHELMEQPEVRAHGAAHGPLGKLVHKLFKTSQKVRHYLTMQYYNVSTLCSSHLLSVLYVVSFTVSTLCSSQSLILLYNCCCSLLIW